MPEQFLWLPPFIAAELPDLARGEDGDDAVPVVRFELVGGVDEDEAEGAGGEFWERAGDVQEVGGGGVREGGVRGGDEEAGIKEGFDIGHSEEGGGGGGEQDDGVGAFGVRDCGAGGEGCGGLDSGVGDWRAAVFALAEEDFGGFPHV